MLDRYLEAQIECDPQSAINEAAALALFDFVVSNSRGNRRGPDFCLYQEGVCCDVRVCLECPFI